METFRTADNGSVIGDIAILSAWFGLVAGLAEAFIFTLVRLVPGWLTWTMRELNVSLDFLWVAPIVNTALFLCAGGLLLIVAQFFTFIPRLRRIDPRAVAAFLLAALGCYVAIRVPGRLYRSTALLLALGVAARVWIWFAAEPQARMVVFRRSVAWLAAGVVAIAATMQGADVLRETLRTRALPAAASGTPNVLLIVLDTVRADHLSAYGYGRPTTPNLSRIAGEGVLFEQAVAPSSWTLASHASLFTGRGVHEHHADSINPVLGPEYPTLAERMAARGFVTAGFSANTFWATRNTGMARGFLHFEDYFESCSDAIARTVLGREIVSRAVRYAGERVPLGRRHASDISGALMHWLDGTRRPFFVFVNYFDAHAPYVVPAPYHTRFMTERQRSWERGFAFRPPLEVADPLATEEDIYTAAYDGGISYLDSEIEKLFQQLQARGLLDDTIVLIVADHGEALSDHGFYDHGHSLYMDQIHVPLILRWPGRIPAGLRVSHPVSTVDVGATILGLVGTSSQPELPGRSLARFWELTPSSPAQDLEPVLSEVGHRDGVPSSWPISTGRVRSLVAGPWHFIERQGGEVELYRLSDDRQEATDLAHDPEAHAMVSRFHDELVEMTSKVRPDVRGEGSQDQ